MIQAFYDWYGVLDPTLRTFWTIALVTSLIFFIQMILTFIGMGDSDVDVSFDADTDFSGGGDTLDVGGALQIFSFRNFINFMLGLGWGGVCLWDTISNKLVLTVVAIVIGIIFVICFLFIYKSMMKLQSNGAYRIQDCVGEVVDVYLRIPAERQGVGKVQVSFGGSVQELTAMTDGEAIPSGAKVRVISLITPNTVLVERIL